MNGKVHSSSTDTTLPKFGYWEKAILGKCSSAKKQQMVEPLKIILVSLYYISGEPVAVKVQKKGLEWESIALVETAKRVEGTMLTTLH